MKQIRFRGLCKIKREWVYGYYAKSGDRHHIISEECDENYQFQTEVYAESVGQLIHPALYEGDLVSVNGHTHEVGDDRIMVVGTKFENPLTKDN
jgi:hypothetical protein